MLRRGLVPATLRPMSTQDDDSPDPGPLLGPIDRSFLWVGRALLIVTVVVAAAFTVPSVGEVYATADYVRAPGRIVHSELERRIVQDEGRSRTEFVASIRYLYTPTAGGAERALLGDRVEVLHVRTGASESELVRRYRAGAEVDVWHDPDEPWRAVLETGGSVWFAFFPPAVTLFLGVLFTVLSSRALRRASTGSGASAVLLDPAQRRTLGGCLTLVAAAFAVVAVLMLVGLLLWGTEPVTAELDASGFEPCEALIEESTFRAVDGRPDQVLPSVSFRYRADGDVRSSGLLTLRSIEPGNAAEWAETVWRAVPGTAATVYVDPEDAARAVLVPGSVVRAAGFSALGLLVPGAVLAFGLVLFAQARRLRASG
jgi:hypothetical protein